MHEQYMFQFVWLQTRAFAISN